MRRPGARLIVALLVCLAAGFVTSWLIMVYLLDTELRLFGLGNLLAIGILITILYIILLDTPLKLGTFEWSEAFWPKGEQFA
ncbi:MAG: hypothetical protein MN733_28520, partial [Nitrososphaera sp.]|nr:hypothetical protein [Nitrososphaera sp.]